MCWLSGDELLMAGLSETEGLGEMRNRITLHSLPFVISGLWKSLSWFLSPKVFKTFYKKHNNLL